MTDGWPACRSGASEQSVRARRRSLRRRRVIRLPCVAYGAGEGTVNRSPVRVVLRRPGAVVAGRPYSASVDSEPEKRAETRPATSGSNPLRASRPYAHWRRARPPSMRSNARRRRSRSRSAAASSADGASGSPGSPSMDAARSPSVRSTRSCSTPRARSSCRSARSPRGRARSRDSTQLRANASSSRKPSSVRRMMAASTSAGGYPDRRSLDRVSVALRARASRSRAPAASTTAGSVTRARSASRSSRAARASTARRRPTPGRCARRVGSSGSEPGGFTDPIRPPRYPPPAARPRASWRGSGARSRG